MSYPTIKFRGWDCEVQVLRYANGRPAIQLVDAQTGEPLARATVNLPDEYLSPNEVFIKNYSENEGILDALVAGGVVVPPHRYVKTGHVRVGQCHLVREVD